MPILLPPGQPLPAAEFPSVEKVVIDRLKATLPTYGYPSMSVVNARTKTTPQVWVRRDGGPVLDQVREAARVGVNVFAATTLDADNLARTVSALLRGAADGDPILRVVQTMGPSPIADSVPRIYMTFEITVRGSVLNPSP
jgi:hypothetical protein